MTIFSRVVEPVCDDEHVVKHARVAAAVALCMAIDCHKNPPKEQTAIDPTLARCVPADAVLVAGIDLAALRNSPLYRKLAASPFAAQLEGVSFALVAYNGKELLIAGRGDFHSPPAGALMLQPNLAVYGSPEEVALAKAQFKSKRVGAPKLLAKAEAVAPGTQVWIAARGSAPLPLSGNAANLTAILRKADFLTLTAQTGSGIVLELRASAPSDSAARAIEETLRADFTLAAAGESKQPELAAALRSVQVSRMDRDVRVTLAANDEIAARLMAMF